MERLEIIEALKHLPNAVEAEIGGLSDSVLRYKPAENEWSIKQIVGHLRDAAEVWHKRIYATWSLTDPVLPAWDTVIGAEPRNFQDADLKTLVDEMREWRLKTVDVLAHAVDWTRVGQHVDLGRRSLKQLAEFMIEHEAEHIAAIRALKAAQATREPG